jgi:hypothetical protein
MQVYVFQHILLSHLILGVYVISSKSCKSTFLGLYYLSVLDAMVSFLAL